MIDIDPFHTPLADHRAGAEANLSRLRRAWRACVAALSRRSSITRAPEQ